MNNGEIKIPDVELQVPAGADGKVRNLSTVAIHTTRGMVPAPVVQNWMSLYTPMNHKFRTIIVSGLDADVALNQAIERILATEHLAASAYILFHEDDNIAPLDGLLTLQKTIGDFDAISGLYVTKDDAHWPLILGDPLVKDDFTPQIQHKEGVHECNGTGLGFVLVKTDVFKKLPKPWFKSVEQPEGPFRRMQHDVFFFYHLKKAGMRLAVNCDCRVGHFDVASGLTFYPPEPKAKESEHA